MSRKPKTEIRNPKQIRIPKTEWDAGAVAFSEDAAFRIWRDETPAQEMALKEGDTAPPAPQRDLLERTALFAEAIIRFVKQVPRGPVTNRLIDQLVGAGSSVAANYCEADDCVSGKDFKKSIGICRKESKETMLFLRLIATSEDSLAPKARTLWREAKELNLIFGAMWRK